EEFGNRPGNQIIRRVASVVERDISADEAAQEPPVGAHEIDMARPLEDDEELDSRRDRLVDDVVGEARWEEHSAHLCARISADEPRGGAGTARAAGGQYRAELRNRALQILHALTLATLSDTDQQSAPRSAGRKV